MSGEPTIVVQYGDTAAANAFFLVELDDKMNLEDDGKTVKTSFHPPDKVWFLTPHDATVQITAMESSSGDVVSEGNVSRDKKDRLSFAEKGKAVEASHIPAGGLTHEWYGNSPLITRKGREIMPSSVPAIGDISYSFSAESWRFDPPDIKLADENDDYPVLIIITVGSIGAS